MKKVSLVSTLLMSVSLLSACNKTTVEKYFVFWLNDDGTLIDKASYKAGEHPVHDIPTSKKTSKLGYHYEFINWISDKSEPYSDDYLMPNEDITFTAFFAEKINSYVVTWKDADGEIIDTTEVEYQHNPTHQDPVKEPDLEKEKEYFFDGWYIDNRKIELSTYEVTEPVTFTAQYEEYNLGGCTYANIEGKNEYFVSGMVGNYPLNVITVLDEYQGLPVTRIGQSAFDQAPIRINNIIIGKNVEIFEVDSFCNSEVDKVTFLEDSQLRIIRESAFFNVKGLTEFIAPSSLERIENLAFAYVPLLLLDLSSVDNVIEMVERPFHGCNLSLLKIKVKNKLLDDYKTAYKNLEGNFVGV